MAKRLTDAEIKTIRDRIEVAGKFVAQELGEEHHTERALQYFKGYHWPKRQSKEPGHFITVNYVQTIIMIKVAALTAEDPRWIVAPKPRDASDLALAIQAALTDAWPDSDGQGQNLWVCLDKHLWGPGVPFTGWRFEKRNVVTEGDPKDASNNSDNGASVRVEPTWDDPCIRRVNPHCFLPDPDEPDLSRMQFCVEEMMVPLRQLRANPRLQHTQELKGAKAVATAYLTPELQSVAETGGLPEDLRRCRIWHYWDHVDGNLRHVVVAEELKDKVLLVEDGPYDYPRQAYPYDIVHHIPVPGEHYGISEFEVLWHQQEEVNKARTRQARHQATSVAKVLLDGRVVTKKVRDALKATDAVALVELALRGNQNLRQVFEVLVPPPMTPEAYNSAQNAIRDMTVESGVTEYQMSMLAPQARAATEVLAVQGGSGGRGRRDVWEWGRFLGAQGKKVVSLMAQFDREAVVPIFDTQQQIQAWRDFRGKEIRGHNWRVTISLQHLMAQVRELERQQVIMVMQSLLPVAQQIGINTRALVEQFLRRFDFDPQEILLPQAAVAPPSPTAPGGPSPTGAGGAAGLPPELLGVLAAAQEHGGGQ